MISGGREYIMLMKVWSRDICSLFVSVFIDIRRFCAYNINGVFGYFGETSYEKSSLN